MKLLAFTDTHGSSLAMKRVEYKVKMQNPDLLVCAGDISIFERGVIAIVKRLNNLNKKIVIIHGNHEDAATLLKCAKLFRNIIFVHKNHFIYENVLFLGFGGGGFSAVDREFEKTAEVKFRKIVRENRDKKVVLITHAPPYRTRLDRLAQGHCGNKSIRHFVDKNKIDLLICGHLHENFGKEGKIGKTKILNPGPFGKVINI